MNVRSSLDRTTKMDADFIKKQAFHDQRILIVSVDDPSIGWVERQMLINVGEKLYGKPKTPTR